MSPHNGHIKAECPYCGRTCTLQTLRYKHKCGTRPGRPKITDEALKAKTMAALAQRLEKMPPEPTQ